MENLGLYLGTLVYNRMDNGVLQPIGVYLKHLDLSIKLWLLTHPLPLVVDMNSTTKHLPFEKKCAITFKMSATAQKSLATGQNTLASSDCPEHPSYRLEYPSNHLEVPNNHP